VAAKTVNGTRINVGPPSRRAAPHGSGRGSVRVESCFRSARIVNWTEPTQNTSLSTSLVGEETRRSATNVPFANGASVRPTLSRDGSIVAFQSMASDLVCEDNCQSGERDINLLWDVFVYNRVTRRTVRASADGEQEWMENSRAPSLDGRGVMLAFGSRHPVDELDAAHDDDVYVWSVRPSPADLTVRRIAVSK
jgi:hypothetical protein